MGDGILVFIDTTEQKLCFMNSSTKSKNRLSFMLRDLDV